MKECLLYFTLIVFCSCASKVSVKEIGGIDNWNLPKKQYEVSCQKFSSIEECLFRLEKICGIQNFAIFPLNTQKAFYKMTVEHEVSYIGSCIKD